MSRVDFDLTNENIREYLVGKRAYIRTEYIAMNKDQEWAVAKIEKEDVNDLFQPIKSIDILSLPVDTSFVDDDTVDVLSASRMGRLRESEGTRCVVVRGKFEHVSFFIDKRPFEITLVDVVPPSPSKLVGLIETALDTYLQSEFVKYKVVERDLNELPGLQPGDAVLFPCRASGLESVGCIGYLDDTPKLTPDEIRSLCLVGCSLSARIFKAVYGIEPRLVNMCPVDLLSDMNIDGPVLTKCCRVTGQFEMHGNIAVVPWGARASDVAAALEALIHQMSS
ncbi:MAG: hypothetical protein JSV94_02280 [Methanobacteriota archaeon]|nr:MAG: hypothetical protein JSV94_02280 [Euryarchaeota archaeon]